MNLDELVEQAQEAAVEYLNAARLDDVEGRYNFDHGITKRDASLLIKAVRGLHRKRRLLEEQLAALTKRALQAETIAADAHFEIERLVAVIANKRKDRRQ